MPLLATGLTKTRCSPTLGLRSAGAALSTRQIVLRATMSDYWKGVLAGGVFFVAASYVLHCKFNMGPWPCQSSDCRHAGNAPSAQLASAKPTTSAQAAFGKPAALLVTY